MMYVCVCELVFNVCVKYEMYVYNWMYVKMCVVCVMCMYVSKYVNVCMYSV